MNEKPGRQPRSLLVFLCLPLLLLSLTGNVGLYLRSDVEARRVREDLLHELWQCRDEYSEVETEWEEKEEKLLRMLQNRDDFYSGRIDSIQNKRDGYRKDFEELLDLVGFLTEMDSDDIASENHLPFIRKQLIRSNKDFRLEWGWNDLSCRGTIRGLEEKLRKQGAELRSYERGYNSVSRINGELVKRIEELTRENISLKLDGKSEKR